ncbi:TRAP transporter large permease [Atopobacter phocae]|uniref:TRAP transporter large permease n=1 Tax=Atopobacter phocae TaxID=136492 RepID=UPI00046F4E67|nr:TRAP transporter large permease [Atopobacter phocae]
MSILVFSGVIMIVVLLLLLLIGTPIAVGIAFSSIVGILPTLDISSALITAAQRIFSGVSVFTLLAIPFFVLAGNIMNKGGIAIKLIRLAQLLMGKLPGGLAMTNILSNMLFGAVSGSGIAAASAMGSIVGPIQESEGYDREYSAATNIASAPTGLLIPPSNVLITYSLISGGTSVAALFLAGYIPGILWGIGVAIVAGIIAKKKGYTGGKRITQHTPLRIILESIPSLLLILIVVGGIIAGVFTATEASCIAVAYALILSFFYDRLDLKALFDIIKVSAETTGIIMLLIGASNIMGWVMSFTGLPDAIAQALLSLSDNRIVILLIINVFLLFIGTFMDITPAILIFTPIFLPIVSNFGMSPIQFGIMITFNLCIGGITPPIGNILYLGARVGNTNVEKVMPELLKYYIAIFVVLLMVTFIPWITMLLPNLLGLK